MSFWEKVVDVAVGIWDEYQVSQIYPTLQDALHKYRGTDEYLLKECAPFSAKLEKYGAFGTKTVTLTVQDDGSVYIVESGFLGEKTVFPKTAGTPTPQQFKQMLQEKKAQNQAPQALKERQNQAPQALKEEERMGFVFETLFLMFGKLAKTDSHVLQKEIDVIKAFMTEFELDQEAQKVAIEFFNEGTATRKPFRELATEFAQYAEEVEMRRDALYCLVQIATADGELHSMENHVLKEAVAAFGLPPSILTEALEEILPDLQKDYAILGCDPSVSDAELTKCYRDLSRQYHPDRISSKDLAPDFTKFAKEKFQEIQNAYDNIIKHRKS